VPTSQAIVFDFDGVIVHSENCHLLAIREVSQRHGVTFTDEAYFRDYVAFSDRDIFPAVWRDSGRSLEAELLARLINEKHARYEQLVDEGRVVAFPGSVELIRAAAERVPVAICSAASRATIEASIHGLGVASCFKTIVSADDVARSKPDPAPYRLAAERLGIAAGRCVAIEDTVGGMRSALGAGYRVVAVCHTMGAERFGEAHLVVEGTAELTVERVLGM
jgi:beta-phosphoglucomutase